jgi:hypothetical protein
VLLFAVFFTWIYGRTIRAEARLLAERFGARYADYARNVPLFMPRMEPYRDAHGASAGFTLERWRRNREYEALLGVVAGFAFLAAKMVWG